MCLNLATDRLSPRFLEMFVGFGLWDVIARRRLTFAQEQRSRRLEEHRISGVV